MTDMLTGYVQTSSGGLVMISLQNETIQAVLFHERTCEAASAALKAFLQRILQRFGEVFKQELDQLQPQLQASATPTPEEVGVACGNISTRCNRVCSMFP